MNCKKCGSPLNEGDVFCQNCGTKVEEMQNNNHGHHNDKRHVNENNERNYEPMNNNGQEYNNAPVNNGPMNNGQEFNNAPVNNGPMNNGQEFNNGSMYGNAPMNNGPMYNNAPMNNGPMYGNTTMNNGPMHGNTTMNNGPMYANPPMNSAPMYGNPNGYYQQPRSGGMGIFAIVGVILLIGIGVLVYFLLKPVNNVNTPAISQNNSYAVNFKGYTFRIPNDYISDVKSDALAFGDKENTWAGAIEIISETYENIRTKMEEIRLRLQSAGYVVNGASIKTISNTEVVTYDITYAGSRQVIAYTKLDSSHVLGLTSMSANNTADYNILGKVVAVGLTGQRTSSNSIAIDDNIDLSVLLEPAQ